jgi:hypothetical protein
MTGFDLEGDHLGHRKSELRPPKIARLVLSLGAKDGLADEVKDGSLRGLAQDSSVKEAMVRIGAFVGSLGLLPREPRAREISFYLPFC